MAIATKSRWRGGRKSSSRGVSVLEEVIRLGSPHCAYSSTIFRCSAYGPIFLRPVPHYFFFVRMNSNSGIVQTVIIVMSWKSNK
jgi:hypothetical protein